MGAEGIRILVVDDDEVLRAGLSLALHGEGYAVEDAADGLTALKQARSWQPNAAVVDIRLPPGPDGLLVGRALRQAGAAVIFLSALDGERDRLDGFAAGADDYIGKPFYMAELLARVRAVLLRTRALPETTLRLGDLVLDEAAQCVARNGVEILLTRTEFKLLTALLRRKGQVLSKARLLSEVWGYESADPNLVETHMSSLRRKLDANGSRLPPCGVSATSPAGESMPTKSRSDRQPKSGPASLGPSWRPPRRCTAGP